MSKITNVYGLPDALVDAVKNDPYEGGGDISVTKLIDAPQRRMLIKQNADLIVEDVSDRIFALMGQAVHAILERAKTSAVVEKRLYMDVAGWKLSGQFDRCHVADGVLQDWKVTSIWKSKGDPSWDKQMNLLRLLLEVNGVPIKKLQVAAIYRDWSRAAMLRTADYPSHNVGLIDVPMWTLEEAERFAIERVEAHKLAQFVGHAECTDEERWYSGNKFALMKNGGKRASKVADTLEEIGEPPKGYTIIKRIGEHRRCKDYCEVANFCPQYRRDKPTEESSDDAFN